MKETNFLREGVRLENIQGDILEICIKYMHYKIINRRVSFDAPEFQIDPDVAKDVLAAAIFL